MKAILARKEEENSNIIIQKQKIVTSTLYARTIQKVGGTFVPIKDRRERSQLGLRMMNQGAWMPFQQYSQRFFVTKRDRNVSFELSPSTVCANYLDGMISVWKLLANIERIQIIPKVQNL